MISLVLTAVLSAGRALGPVPVLPAVAILGALAVLGPVTGQAEDLYRAPTASAAARADDLLGRLTVDEKIAQLMNHAPAVPRVGLPAFDYWSEGLHGLARNGYATVFPQAIGLAASWDTALLHDVGDVVSAEARAKFIGTGSEAGQRYAGLTIWSPNINIFRDPRWGRGQETYGEDPYLTGRLAISFVTGLQGDDPLHPRTIATPKHLAVHSGPEPIRHGFDARVSAHDLEDTYLAAFRAAIVEGRAGSTMCAYNGINGPPACANEDLLQRRLRGDWAFNGLVVSDCDAVEDMTAFHHYRPDDAHSAAAALKAGTDLDCGRTYGALRGALDLGLIAESDLDHALRRVLTARFALGTLDQAVGSPQSSEGTQSSRGASAESNPLSRPDLASNSANPASATSPAAPDRPSWSAHANGIAPTSATESNSNSPEHESLALRAARESIVLLKNTGGMLPLASSGRAARIAVIGPTADLLEVLEGNYHGTARAPVTPLAGIRQQFGAASVSYALGSTLADGVSIPIPASALLGPDGSTGGLQAEFFASPDFAPSPLHIRRDPNIDFDWNRVAPMQGLSADQYAVRWTGKLVPPAPGEYRLQVAIDRCFDCKGHDRYQLSVDGRPVDDGSGKVAPLVFKDTAPHSVLLELVHQSADGGVHLEWQAPAEALLREAVATAKRADVVVACVGLSPRLEGEALQIEVPGFKGGDRTSLDLPGPQRALLNALAKTGRPLVVALLTGSAAVLDPATERAARAILVDWYPGESGGRALAETLAGLNNPAGRLPVTFYNSVNDLPAFENYSMAGRTYRYFTGTPRYPFGYGLSFTTFRYDSIELSAQQVDAGGDVEMQVHVTNTGHRDGDEVIQLYLSRAEALHDTASQAAASHTAHPSSESARSAASRPEPSSSRASQSSSSPSEATHSAASAAAVSSSLLPRRALVGFQRVHLAAGESTTVHFTIGPRAMSVVDANGSRAVVPGTVIVNVGGGQPGYSATVSGSFTVTGQLEVPR